MADTFTKDRLDWLDRISQDGSLPEGAFRVAYVISGHINRDTMDAWPGLDRLASALGKNEKSVRRLVDELVAAGYLSKKRGGDGRPNRYRMVLSDRTEMSDQNGSRPDENVQSGQVRADNNVQSEGASEEQTGHFCPSDRTFLSQQTGQNCPPNSLNEPSEELSEKNIYLAPPTPEPPKAKEKVKAKAKAEVEDERFTEFWRVYPKKVAKAGAVAAWTKARKTADPEAIIAGAMRYAAERTGQDPTYTAHPATWLNKGRWEDEAAPPRPPSAPAPGGGLTAKERTRAVVRHILASVEANPDGEEAA